jgi:hypothetical protein
MEFFNVRMLSGILFENNEAVYNGNINEVEEQSLPPPQALSHYIISSYNLIRAINSIHIGVIPLYGSWLLHLYLSPNIICLGFPVDLHSIVSIINRGEERHYLIIFPL